MAHIDRFPFMDDFKDKMLADPPLKTMTTRSKKYGNVGDTFAIFGAVFEITEEWRGILSAVASKHWAEEGCDSEDDFIHVWEALHPRRGFNPTDRKWSCRFKRIR